MGSVPSSFAVAFGIVGHPLGPQAPVRQVPVTLSPGQGPQSASRLLSLVLMMLVLAVG